MDRTELLREAKDLHHATARARIALDVKKEKDSANYKRDRKQLARTLTALNEMQRSKKASSKTSK
mgnify:CR=1 FL=1